MICDPFKRCATAHVTCYNDGYLDLQTHLSIKAEKLTVQASQRQYMQLQRKTTDAG